MSLVAWLASLGLAGYVDALSDAGFTTLQACSSLTESSLPDAVADPLHRRSIAKAAAKLRSRHGISRHAPPTAPPPIDIPTLPAAEDDVLATAKRQLLRSITAACEEYNSALITAEAMGKDVPLDAVADVVVRWGPRKAASSSVECEVRSDSIHGHTPTPAHPLAFATPSVVHPPPTSQTAARAVPLCDTSRAVFMHRLLPRVHSILKGYAGTGSEQRKRLRSGERACATRAALAALCDDALQHRGGSDLSVLEQLALRDEVAAPAVQAVVAERCDVPASVVTALVTNSNVSVQQETVKKDVRRRWFQPRPRHR